MELLILNLIIKSELHSINHTHKTKLQKLKSNTDLAREEESSRRLIVLEQCIIDDRRLRSDGGAHGNPRFPQIKPRKTPDLISESQADGAPEGIGVAECRFGERDRGERDGGTHCGGGRSEENAMKWEAVVVVEEKRMHRN